MISLRIFCDFDGTIAKRDVGNLVFTQFGNENHWWRLVHQWKIGELEGREMWRRQAATMTLTPSQLDVFAATQLIDPTFADFYAFTRRENVPMYIVSDGMDAYISRILAYYGFADLQLRTNRLIFNQDGRLDVEFPYHAEGCGQCANCKGVHVRKERLPGETTVFIGDGLSDACGAREADVVFAKKQLLTYCEEKGIPHIPFRAFSEVQSELERMMASQ
jgi:2,3-diketo-5-methylthio-1-phosphopentane phosphatase